MRPLLDKTFAALASFALTIVVLSLLLLLVVIGTLEQTHTSLFEVQTRYFDSLFVIHHVRGIPVPLPGVYLLLIVLSVNLICGGIVRIRKDLTTLGVIVAHLGILWMFAGAAIEFTWSQKGHTTMAEGTDANEFVSYYEWEIAIAEAKDAGPVVESLVPGEQFMGLKPGARATFTSPDLPFDLIVHDVKANCEPQPASFVAGAPSVDGFALAELPRQKEAEQDVAGAYVTVVPKSGGAPVEGVLWGRDRIPPMSATVDGRRWTIDLSHRRFPLPFSVHLDDFRREMHPGTGKPKSFESDVTRVRNGVAQSVKISMNQPLNQDGYKLFQSGFIEPPNGGGRWWSTFSVVRNPADRIPLWSCIVITIGLLLHFSQKLVRHVRTQSWRRA
jgi:ResB-like family protein